MNDRDRVMAVLTYRLYDRLPIVHFGFWDELLEKWADEGHLTREEARDWGDGNPVDAVITAKLGFDCNYYSAFHPNTFLRPGFEQRVIEEMPDGSRKLLNGEGVIVLWRPDATGIPSEFEHLLKDRASWEEHYLPKLLYSDERVTQAPVRVNQRMVPFNGGGLKFLRRDERAYHYGLHCGSLYGNVRNILGLVGSAYLLADDEPLFTEIIDTVGELCYQCVKRSLESGAKFDFAHFWEDICYKQGPIIRPSVFAAKVSPHYRRITDLVRSYGIEIVSLDCDGMIDDLIPVWFENGVNTMFPIEVGTWGASIAPWRERYGRDLRGVGGTNKVVFAGDRAAIDAEIERLKPLVELGGYVPCPDHRLPLDAEWDNVLYYCDQMRATFG